MAVIFSIMALLLMSALGGALILTTSTETMIAANFRRAQEGMYAADAAVECAMDDLATIADWNAVLNGSTRSAFVDGLPSGIRALADGSRLDLNQTLNMMNCRKVTPCTASNLTANTSERPWGANNPVWRLFAYGSLSSLLPAGTIDPGYYVIVAVADDPSENDNDPLRDGVSATNPGTGVLTLRGEAFGPQGSHQVVEVTIARAGVVAGAVRVLSWRLVRPTL